MSFINCSRNPTSTCTTENWRKHNSGKQPTVDCTLNPIQRSGVKHSVGKVIPYSIIGRQETPWKLEVSSPWYFKLQWMSCSRRSGMSNSSRSRWTLAEQTMIRAQHTNPSNTTSTTRNSDQSKAWPTNTPGAQEVEDDFQQLTPTPENNTQGLGDQMQNSNEVSTEVSTNIRFTNLKIQFAERHWKQYHAHGLRR